MHNYLNTHSSADENMDGFQYMAIANNAAEDILSVSPDVYMPVFCIYMPDNRIIGLWTSSTFMSNT